MSYPDIRLDNAGYEKNSIKQTFFCRVSFLTFLLFVCRRPKYANFRTNIGHWFWTGNTGHSVLGDSGDFLADAGDDRRPAHLCPLPHRHQGRLR